MPVPTIDRAVSALRQRMIEDMAMRGLRSDTQHEYIRFVRSFAAFLGQPPDTATAEDIRRFQVHQRESGVQPPTINCSVSALRFFFTVALDRPDLSRRLVLARYPRKLPAVLSVDHANSALGYGTRPIEGRKPTTLQNAAGLRREPPASEPEKVNAALAELPDAMSPSTTG